MWNNLKPVTCLSSVTSCDLEIEPFLWIPGVAIKIIPIGKDLWFLPFSHSFSAHVLLIEANILQDSTQPLTNYKLYLFLYVYILKCWLPSTRLIFSSVQFTHSVVSDSLRPHEFAARQASLSITNSQRSLKLMSVESVMPSSHLILCRPLLLLPLIPPSIRVFSNESALRTRWPKYWSFSFSISPSNEYPGLISFRMDWLDLLAVQGTLKSLLQHHGSKTSILEPWTSRCSSCF